MQYGLDGGWVNYGMMAEEWCWWLYTCRILKCANEHRRERAASFGVCHTPWLCPLMFCLDIIGTPDCR